MSTNPFDKRTFTEWLILKGKVSSFNSDDIDVVYTKLSPWFAIGLDKVKYPIEISDDDYVHFKGKVAGVSITLRSFLEHGDLISALSSYAGFSSLGDSFKNPEQIHDTLFEIRCMNFVVKNFKTTGFEISPPVTVKGSLKYPDFKFENSGKQIFCECKSLETVNRGKESRAFQLIKTITPYLNSQFKTDMRLEIAFSSLPPHWNRNFGDQLSGAFGELLRHSRTDLNVHLRMAHNHKKYSAYILIAKKSEAPKYKGLSVGDVPGPDGRNSNLLVTELLDSKKAVKRTILDACTQLPESKLSLIFINPLEQNGFTQAVDEYFQSPSRSGSVVAVAEERNGNISFKVKKELDSVFRAFLK